MPAGLRTVPCIPRAYRPKAPVRRKAFAAQQNIMSPKPIISSMADPGLIEREIENVDDLMISGLLLCMAHDL